MTQVRASDALHDLPAAVCAAAMAVDRACEAMGRADGEEAIDAWGALLSGQWSLVHHFEQDGRRYLVARRSNAKTRHHPALSRRETQVAGHAALGHSNKFIAFQLGLALSTVATHLAKALRKLGVSSRRELVQLFGPSTSE